MSRAVLQHHGRGGARGGRAQRLCGTESELARGARAHSLVAPEVLRVRGEERRGEEAKGGRAEELQDVPSIPLPSFSEGHPQLEEPPAEHFLPVG
ncbi:hypothetical protein MHYP_G00233330 [Metynnis hypsauchen]